MTRYFVLKSCTLAALSALSAQAIASGYHFGAQSVSAVSTANSNEAEAADPSTIFHNPAGLTYLPGAQISGNLFLVAPSVKYRNAKGQYFVTHHPIQGKTSGTISDSVVLVPQLYASYQINDRVSAGLGLYVPFASATEYSMDSVLRYNVNQTKLTTYDINPTVAFKLGERHSIGIGVIAQYTDAKLRQFADFSPALSASLSKKLGKHITLPYGQGDGYAELEGNDWGFGYNIGWLWDVTDNVRLGLNYRSKVDHTLKGEGKWHLVGDAFKHPAYGKMAEAGIRGAGYVASEDVSVKVNTPESLSLHAMWQVNPKWKTFGDITWTRHSRFDDLVINWEKTKRAPDGVMPGPGNTVPSDKTSLRPHWKNTWKFAVGAAYQISDPLQLRIGLSHDRAPVRSADERLSTMPDNDRTILGLGAKYDINKNSTLNLAYAYMHIKSAHADVNGWCGSSVEMGAGAKSCVSSRASGSADYRSNAHIFGVQYTHRF